MWILGETEETFYEWKTWYCTTKVNQWTCSIQYGQRFVLCSPFTLMKKRFYMTGTLSSIIKIQMGWSLVKDIPWNIHIHVWVCSHIHMKLEERERSFLHFIQLSGVSWIHSSWSPCVSFLHHTWHTRVWLSIIWKACQANINCWNWLYSRPISCLIFWDCLQFPMPQPFDTYFSLNFRYLRLIYPDMIKVFGCCVPG